MIGRDEDVQIGDRIITSGIAEIREIDSDPEGLSLTPRNLLVGTVKNVDTPSDNVFKRIIVDPAASLDYNETVFVVIPLVGYVPEGGRPR